MERIHFESLQEGRTVAVYASAKGRGELEPFEDFRVEDVQDRGGAVELGMGMGVGKKPRGRDR